MQIVMSSSLGALEAVMFRLALKPYIDAAIAGETISPEEEMQIKETLEFYKDAYDREDYGVFNL